MHNYSGKNILITGGSKGIGKEIAIEFAKRGANLFLVARDQKTLALTQLEILNRFPSVRCSFFPADVSDFGQVEASVAKMLEEFSGIDGLVNNAGFAIAQYFEKIPPLIFSRSVSVNYLGPVYFTKVVVPHLRAGAFISFTSSVAGFMGVFGYASYVGPKYAINGFAETIRQELKSKDIQVSVLCPPDTNTPAFEIESQNRPFETNSLSSCAKIMEPNQVARRFVDKLSKGRFLITVNAESEFYYRLTGIAPELTRWIMSWMIGRAQAKGKKNCA